MAQGGTMYGVNANAFMPMIDRGAHHRVNVLALKNLAVIGVGLDLVLGIVGHKFLGVIRAMGGDVTHRGLRDVIPFGMLAHLPNVGAKPTAAHAHKTNCDPVIRAFYIN